MKLVTNIIHAQHLPHIQQTTGPTLWVCNHLNPTFKWQIQSLTVTSHMPALQTQGGLVHILFLPCSCQKQFKKFMNVRNLRVALLPCCTCGTCLRWPKTSEPMRCWKTWIYKVENSTRKEIKESPVTCSVFSWRLCGGFVKKQNPKFCFK